MSAHAELACAEVGQQAGRPAEPPESSVDVGPMALDVWGEQGATRSRATPCGRVFQGSPKSVLVPFRTTTAGTLKITPGGPLLEGGGAKHAEQGLIRKVGNTGGQIYFRCSVAICCPFCPVRSHQKWSSQKQNLFAGVLRGHWASRMMSNVLVPKIA